MVWSELLACSELRKLTACATGDIDIMTKLSIVAILAGLTIAGASIAADLEPPLEVTTFELKDGAKFHAVSFASAGRDDLRSFIISTPEGTKAIILAKVIVNCNKESIA